MERLEMVERIRERANVSYEEAKNVLEENNWDLLEALTALERAGRMASGKEEKQAEENRSATAEEPKDTKPTEKEGLRDKIRCLIRYCSENEIQLKRKGEIILQVPLSIMLIILLLTWEVMLPIMVISLLFGVDYHFVGKENMEKVSEVLDRTEAAAAKVKEEIAGVLE